MTPGAFLHDSDDPWRTFGTEDLCTWREPGEPGVAIFQTSRPEFAKKLSKRAGCSPFRSDCGGGYLRMFSERMQAWQARRLVTRYLKAANEGFSCPAVAPRHICNRSKVVAPGTPGKRLAGTQMAKTHHPPARITLP